MIKRVKSIMFLCAVAVAAFAQNDPVVMTINGVPVTRSEFEYSYNKNNSEGVIDKKTVEEYVDLFINYKLKVAAALDAKMDTMTSFKEEFAKYRDLQVRPSFVTDDDIQAMAHKIYDDTQHYVDSLGGLARPMHILVKVDPGASPATETLAKLKADSIYRVIANGGDFTDMARRFSDDPGSAQKGGEIGWIQPGQTVKEFENAVYSLKEGEVARPVKSAYGFHIVKLLEKKPFVPFDSCQASILTYIDRTGIRDQIIDEKIDGLVAASNGQTREQVLEQRAADLSAEDSDLANLIREYHDGLLLWEISYQKVYGKAENDEAGLENYFKNNKKKYKWDSPRFKGIAYHVKDKADVKAVKKCVKGEPFDKWPEKLHAAFNADSVIRIRVVKGIFKVGDNPLVDREAFKKKVDVPPTKDYPIDAIYGKVLKAPKEYTDVRGQVLEDYQNLLDKQWIEELRKQYVVTVNRDVLATVNKH